ncbi:mRNA-decapping enzyme subunit 2-like isoform X2 [Punica granatum]|uniref:mRNA-decapping enzyme subunit 2-like isoform X2 n=1 Tax=Punica granatum TaxID=22663 RepID=A0A6P8BSA9_PUNGR|nr:mRNA-decapping enzyme subunit 2-like isoform X2 [Punica granatum]
MQCRRDEDPRLLRRGASSHRRSSSTISAVFQRCEVFRPYAVHIDEIFKMFTSYKLRVPVFGAIILDESSKRCLLVKGWKGHTWSFPRGKRNKLEEDHDCAIREVLEETGFDISNLLNKNEYIEKTFGTQRVRLYIIAGVKSNTSFAPLTKKEIREIGWHCLDKLECGNDSVLSRGGIGPRLYMVAPFLKSLKSWISEHPALVAQGSAVPTKGKLIWSAQISPTQGQLMITKGESESSKSPPEASPSDTRPGKSFRNFSFNTPAILNAMEAAFGA